jgi:hypothetical protein
MHLRGTTWVVLIHLALYGLVLVIGIFVTIWRWAQKRGIERAKHKAVEKQIRDFVKELETALDKHIDGDD